MARAAGLESVARTRALDGAAVLAFTHSDYAEAKAIAAEYLALSEAIGHVWGAAVAHNLIGVVARAEGDFDRAAAAFTEALTLFQRQALAGWAALALLNLGTIAYWQGAWERASALGSEALMLFRRQEDDYGTAVALSVSGSGSSAQRSRVNSLRRGARRAVSERRKV